MTNFTHIASVSGQDVDKVLKQITLCDLAEKDYPERNFYNAPPNLRTLSPKITSACQRIFTGELGRRMTQLAEDLFKQGRTLPGLLCLRRISNWYKARTKGDALYGIQHLQAVHLVNNDLESFESSRVMVYSGLTYRFPDEQIEEFITKRLKTTLL